MTTLVRAPVPALSTGERALEADASHYLTRVLRLSRGAHFLAFDPERAVEADAELVRVEQGTAIVRIGETRPARIVATRAVTWIQALAKGDKCDAIVRDATELGATRLIVVATERSVVRLDETRTRAKTARWTKIAHEAARQSGRADPPEIVLAAWPAALTLVSPDSARFCLDPASQEPLGPMLALALTSSTPLAFAAGPEGGLTTDEIALAKGAGWRVASLGPFILRTETVATAVLGAVRLFAAPKSELAGE